MVSILTLMLDGMSIEVHPIEKRLARWLLVTQDRVGTHVLPLTHEFLSQMLGVNRSTGSIRAVAMPETGLIEYRRGKVRILERRRLEKASCECYQTMNKQLKTWDAESAASLH